MATLQALRFHGKEDVRVESIQPQKCGKDEVRIKVAYCGICGSDIHEYMGGPIFPPPKGEKNPYTRAELPITLGHEMSGVIAEIGSSVDGLKVGQKVTVNPSVDDRHHGLETCKACVSGRPNCCKRWACYGLSAIGGGLAEEIVVKKFSCIPLPDGISLKVGALAEPLAVASHMLRISGFTAGQNIVVLGAGPIGLALLLLLRARGARIIIVSEVTELRSEQARRFGADIVVNPLSDPKTNAVVDAVHKTMDDGADISFDASGLQSTLDTAIEVVKAGGIVFNVAIHEKALQINPNSFTFKEAKLMGGLCYTNEDFKNVLDELASGKLPAAQEMITSVVPLENSVDGAFLELINNKTKHVKILIQPSQDPDLLYVSCAV